MKPRKKKNEKQTKNNPKKPRASKAADAQGWHSGLATAFSLPETLGRGDEFQRLRAELEFKNLLTCYSIKNVSKTLASWFPLFKMHYYSHYLKGSQFVLNI